MNYSILNLKFLFLKLNYDCGTQRSTSLPTHDHVFGNDSFLDDTKIFIRWVHSFFYDKSKYFHLFFMRLKHRNLLQTLYCKFESNKNDHKHIIKSY